jgi:hypothetical protein
MSFAPLSVFFINVTKFDLSLKTYMAVMRVASASVTVLGSGCECFSEPFECVLVSP